ncbi:hypothetical protein EAI89_10395 [Eubacterium sp. am_0171]|nr:hypothetical protein EAI89_10395 [Eubacterium sp. am_0171]
MRLNNTSIDENRQGTYSYETYVPCLFLYNRKVLCPFLLYKKPSGRDAHAAIRYIAAKRHRGGAKVCKPLMSEGLGSPCGLAHFVLYCMESAVSSIHAFLVM